MSTSDVTAIQRLCNIQHLLHDANILAVELERINKYDVNELRDKIKDAMFCINSLIEMEICG